LPHGSICNDKDNKSKSGKRGLSKMVMGAPPELPFNFFKDENSCHKFYPFPLQTARTGKQALRG